MSDWISQTLYSNGTMKNKLHIHDKKELEKKEYLITSRNASLFLM
ncbi:cell division protein, partial [Lactobacillus sp. XV13L]|nr:cell division protein [Lactobacillus sp. XV13L]